jgi:hypothetical protein
MDELRMRTIDCLETWESEVSAELACVRQTAETDIASKVDEAKAAAIEVVGRCLCVTVAGATEGEGEGEGEGIKAVNGLWESVALSAAASLARGREVASARLEAQMSSLRREADEIRGRLAKMMSDREEVQESSRLASEARIQEVLAATEAAVFAEQDRVWESVSSDAMITVRRVREECGSLGESVLSSEQLWESVSSEVRNAVGLVQVSSSQRRAVADGLGTITAAATTATAHGLGARPRNLRVTLYCDTADTASAYAVGDEIEMYSTNQAFSVYSDATNVNILRNSTGTLTFIKKGTGVAATAPTSVSNFSFRIYAEL